MTEYVSPVDKESHRKLAASLFNYTWTLLDKPDRTQMDDDMMVHSAHASRFHWGMCGTPLHFARGEWQISRVYSVLRRSEPALYHANRCFALCTKHDLGAFDQAFAYEALARAHAVAGNDADSSTYIELAKAESTRITDDEDRKLLLDDLDTIGRA